MERLAQWYANREGLWGIEILNEPINEQLWSRTQNHYIAVDKEEADGSGPVTSEFLRNIYIDAYRRMRKHLPEEKVIVFQDGFRLHEWKGFMREPEFVNVVLDTHMYLRMAAYTGLATNVDEFVSYIENSFAKEVAEMQTYFPVIVGEWCLSTIENNFRV